MRLHGLEGVPELGYGFLENMSQGRANKMGVSPAQYQAGAWLGGAEKTGVLSGNEPFLKHVENQIETTADILGQSKAKTLRDLIRARIPLLGENATGLPPGM